MIKTLNKVDIEGTYLNIIQTIHMYVRNPQSASHSVVKSSKLFNRMGVPTLATCIQHSTGSPNHSNQTRKRHKRILLGKKKVKLSLFADDMILYKVNLKHTTKKLLRLNK